MPSYALYGVVISATKCDHVTLPNLHLHSSDIRLAVGNLQQFIVYPYTRSYHVRPNPPRRHVLKPALHNSSSTMANGSTATVSPATPRKRVIPQWTRAEIATRIAKGQSLVLKNDAVLNVSSWADYHPGGALALAHFVGRDAADEIAAYHSDATLGRMRSFTVATVHPQDWSDEMGWKPLTPPIALGLAWDGKKWTREGAVLLAKGIVGDDEVVTLTAEMLEPAESGLDGRVERTRSKAYHELKRRVEDAGLFTPPGPLAGYGKDVVRYLLLAGSAAYLFFTSTGWAGQMTSAVLLGLLFQQLTCECSSYPSDI